MTAVGDECTIDLDCTFKNATCRDFICIEQSEFKETVEFSTDIILTAVVNKSTGENYNWWVCNVYSLIVSRSDYAYIRMILLEIRVGSNCTTNEDCSELGNATCDLTGTCRCVRAHFAPYEDAKCIPGKISDANASTWDDIQPTDYVDRAGRILWQRGCTWHRELHLPSRYMEMHEWHGRV